jgi:hypothetical protein
MIKTLSQKKGVLLYIAPPLTHPPHHLRGGPLKKRLPDRTLGAKIERRAYPAEGPDESSADDVALLFSRVQMP